MSSSGRDGSTLSCSMNGYRTLVNDILKLSLLAISLNVSTIQLVLSGAPDLSKAFGLTYEFLLGAGGWIGYVVAAIYYFGTDAGIGPQICTASQYGYLVIYYLNIAISFGQSA